MGRRRIWAGALDLACLLGWAGLLGLGLWAITSSGALPGATPFALQLGYGLAVVVPAVIGFAWFEGGRYEATAGKQWAGLRVRSVEGAGLDFPRALARNTVKVGLPWALAQAAVVVGLSGGFRGFDTWVLIGCAGLLPIVNLVSMLIGDRRTLYDLTSGSEVIQALAARRAL